MSLVDRTDKELQGMLNRLDNLRKRKREVGSLLKYQIHQEIIRREKGESND